jgi:hypothetical protein
VHLGVCLGSSIICRSSWPVFLDAIYRIEARFEHEIRDLQGHDSSTGHFYIFYHTIRPVETIAVMRYGPRAQRDSGALFALDTGELDFCLREVAQYERGFGFVRADHVQILLLPATVLISLPDSVCLEVTRPAKSSSSLAGHNKIALPHRDHARVCGTSSEYGADSGEQQDLFHGFSQRYRGVTSRTLPA